MGFFRNKALILILLFFAQNFKLPIVPTLHALKVLEQSGWIILTDSVFLPATFKIIVGREQLYDYQLKNKQFDKLLKTLLRSHQGADKQAVPVREAQLAYFLEMDKQKVIKGLELFHRDRIIEYIPPKNKPQLLFAKERVHAELLRIDEERYRFRKDRHLMRLESLFSYLESDRCRDSVYGRIFWGEWIRGVWKMRYLPGQ